MIWHRVLYHHIVGKEEVLRYLFGSGMSVHVWRFVKIVFPYNEDDIFAVSSKMLHLWLDHIQSRHSQFDHPRHSDRRNPRQHHSHLAENIHSAEEILVAGGHRKAGNLGT